MVAALEDEVDFCCWSFELVFWLSVPESHFRRRRAENRFTRGGRLWGTRRGEGVIEEER